MGKKGDNEDEAERAKRIAELKRQAEELAGGKMVEGEMEETPPEVAEGFWQHVVDYEKAPWTTNFKQLEEAGTMPSASTTTAATSPTAPTRNSASTTCATT